MFACHAQYYFVHDIILVGFLLLPIKAARPSKEGLSEEKAKAEDRTAGDSVEGDSGTLKPHEKTGGGPQATGVGSSKKED